MEISLLYVSPPAIVASLCFYSFYRHFFRHGFPLIKFLLALFFSVCLLFSSLARISFLVSAEIVLWGFQFWCLSNNLFQLRILVWVSEILTLPCSSMFGSSMCLWCSSFAKFLDSTIFFNKSSHIQQLLLLSFYRFFILCFFFLVSVWDFLTEELF